MILDGNMMLDPTGTGITTGGPSVNLLDLMRNRDIGPGKYRGSVIVFIGAPFSSATPTATLTVQLQAAPDNGSGSPSTYTTIVDSGAIPLGQLAASSKVAQFPISTIADAQVPPIETTGSWSAGPTTSIVVASGAGILDGMYVAAGSQAPISAANPLGGTFNGLPGSSFIIPGTTVAAGAGTTSLTLNQNTASASGTNVPLTFQGVNMTYRFLRLNYVVSATMTSGTITSYVAMDVDQQLYLPAGVSVAWN